MNKKAEFEELSFHGCEDNKLAASFYPAASDPAVRKPAAVFMHGGGQTRHSWHGSAQQISALGIDSYTVDARGHGDSEWVGSGNYTFKSYAADLLAITRQVTSLCDGHAPILVGASMGGISGMLAQHVHDGSDSNNLFSALVLVDITPRMASSGVDKIMGFMSKDMRKGFAAVEEAADAIAAYLPNRARPKSLNGLRKNLRQRDDGRWYWHWDPAFVDGENSILENFAPDGVTRQEYLLEAAASITMPTLLVRGGKSELVTREAADEFLELVPSAKYVDVTDAGHMVAGDKNDVFAEAVIDFLKDEQLV